MDDTRLSSLIDGLMKACRRGAVHSSEGPEADNERAWRKNLEVWIEALVSKADVDDFTEDGCVRCGRRCSEVKLRICCFCRAKPPVRIEDVCELCRLPERFAR